MSKFSSLYILLQKNIVWWFRCKNGNSLVGLVQLNPVLISIYYQNLNSSHYTYVFCGFFFGGYSEWCIPYLLKCHAIQCTGYHISQTGKNSCTLNAPWIFTFGKLLNHFYSFTKGTHHPRIGKKEISQGKAENWTHRERCQTRAENRIWPHPEKPN